MKIVFSLALIFSLFIHQATAQSTEKLAATILQEGLALYHSERASWVATDMLLAQNPDKAQLQGYLSYTIGDSVRTVFFRKQQTETEPLQVAYSFTFPAQDIQAATVKQKNSRAANDTEQYLFTVRKKAFTELQTGTKLGEAYRIPAKTRPNIAMLLAGKKTKAYVLSGPEDTRLIIGSDYLFTFDQSAALQSVERLHKSFLEFKRDQGQASTESIFHSHLEAHPYITATDICSILLYQDILPHAQHIVISKDYVSIFDVSNKRLAILTRKAWDRINKSTD